MAVSTLSKTKPRVTVPKKKLAAFCKRWKVSELAFFGSVLREDFRPNSDIDLLVSFSPRAKVSLFDLVRMQNELKEIFGRNVDLVERRAIEKSENYIRRKNILSNTKVVYAARKAYLLDILISARKALKFVKDIDRNEFEGNEVIQNAVLRPLEVIGEASGKISKGFRELHTEIPWEDMIDLRNRLIHEYFRVDYGVVWDTIQNELPRLIEQIEPLVPKEDEI